MARAARNPPRRAGPRARTTASEPRPARTKLDPRLAYLAGLPLAALRRLQEAEEKALRRVAKRFSEPRPAAEGADAARAAEELRALETQLFAPLTTGLHLPKPGRPRARRRDIRDRSDEPVFSVFILGDASAADLRRFGAVPRCRSCDVSTAFLPRSALRAIERSPAIRFVELARPWFYDLDDAVSYAQMDALHGAAPAIDGAGVIVGVVDNVIDVHHPDFRNATGQTRLRFLWDQLLGPAAGEAGPPVGPTLPDFIPQGGATYGVEYDGAAIDAELAAFAPGAPAYQTVRHAPPPPPVSVHAGHGNFVTGCAAGNGRGGGSAGGAPESAIIFVSPLGYVDDVNIFADNVAVVDGCSYIFARAAQAGLPCVVNLSMGDNQGPHDGTTSGERFLDQLLTVPGRAITISAGNSTGTRAHAAGVVAPGGTANLVLTYAPNPQDQLEKNPVKSDAIEVWYDGHDRFTVTVTAPTAPPTTIGPVAPGTTLGPLPAGAGGVTVTVTSTINDARNGDNLVSIIITVPAGEMVPLGDWTVALAGTTVINGAFHAWVDRNNRGKSAWRTPFLQDTRLTLGVPATARRPISVGNHTKAGPPPVIHARSGLGPTRDARIKPEIAAVGTGVASPSPRNMNASLAGQPLYQDAAVIGTSFSAPLVAGACALLFQCRGAAATCADLKQILTDTAGTAGLAIPSNAFGFGFLHVAAACTAAAVDVDVWLRDHPADLGLEPSTATVFWACPDIEILDAAGNPVPNPTHTPGARFNNIIRVTVRSRGAQPARNVSVFLYWADPATNLPFPEAWRSTGIYTGAGGFPDQGNSAVIPQLAPGGAAVVDFAWAPPAPGSGLAGDGHFCLLVRLEQEADPSNISAGGFAGVTASNNIGLRNVLVQP